MKLGDDTITQIVQSKLPRLGSTVSDMGPPLPTKNNPDYDMIGYIEKHGIPDQSKGQLLTDEFKLPNHITFSDQSKYHSDATPGGTWQQGGADSWLSTPSSHNLKIHSPNDMADYFRNYERKGTKVQLPDGRVVGGSL